MVFLFAILVLGAGVFSWGTAYKMSLYRISPIHNKVPVAKLSTQSGTAIKDQIESATMPRPVMAFRWLLDLALFVFALTVLLAFHIFTLAREPRRLFSLYFPPASFLRPPPFSFHG